MSKLSDLKFLWLILPILEAEHGYASSLPSSDQNQIISNKNQRLKNSTKKAHGSRWVVRHDVKWFYLEQRSVKLQKIGLDFIKSEFPRVLSREATAAGSFCHFIWWLFYWLLCCWVKITRPYLSCTITKGTEKNLFYEKEFGRRRSRMACQWNINTINIDTV